MPVYQLCRIAIYLSRSCRVVVELSYVLVSPQPISAADTKCAIFFIGSDPSSRAPDCNGTLSVND